MGKNMKMIKCIKCKENMPELRLTEFGYKVCINCSTTGAYKAVCTVNGTGDHTWNDIQIVTAEQAELFAKQNKNIKLLDSYSSID